MGTPRLCLVGGAASGAARLGRVGRPAGRCTHTATITTAAVAATGTSQRQPAHHAAGISPRAALHPPPSGALLDERRHRRLAAGTAGHVRLHTGPFVAVEAALRVEPQHLGVGTGPVRVAAGGRLRPRAARVDRRVALTASSFL